MILIDASNIVIRSLSIPEILQMKNSKGFHTGGVYGFLNSTLSLSKKFKDKNILAAFDYAGSRHRKALSDEYKANREKTFSLTPEEKELKELKKLVFAETRKALHQEVLPKLGIKSLVSKGIEADDLIHYICRNNSDDNEEMIIVSTDKDYYQLLDDTRVKIYNPATFEVIDYNTLISEYGFSHEYSVKDQFIMYKSLLGDDSDNISGISGVGKVYAKKLVQIFFKKEFNDPLYEKFICGNPDKHNKNVAKLNKKLNKAALTPEELESLEHSKKIVESKSFIESENLKIIEFNKQLIDMALLDQDSLDCIKDAYKFVLENDYSSEFLDAIEFMKVLEITNLTDKLYQHFH